MGKGKLRRALKGILNYWKRKGGSLIIHQTLQSEESLEGGSERHPPSRLLPSSTKSSGSIIPELSSLCSHPRQFLPLQRSLSYHPTVFTAPGTTPQSLPSPPTMYTKTLVLIMKVTPIHVEHFEL